MQPSEQWATLGTINLVIFISLSETYITKPIIIVLSSQGLNGSMTKIGVRDK